VQRVEQAMTHRPLSKLIVTSVKDYLPFPKNILYPLAAKKDGTNVSVTYDDRIVSFTRLMKQSSSDPVKVDIDAEQDLALIQYTGG
ncbi:hypothetical protein RA282_29220, partial [Pseudomonas syringae pv. tagetis]